MKTSTRRFLRRVLGRPVVVLPILMSSLLITIVLAVVTRDTLRAWMSGPRHAWIFGAREFSVELSPVLNKKLRVVTVSRPFDSEGCERLMGAAIARYHVARFDPSTMAFSFNTMRYLLKFKYNLKRGTCEAKDLAFTQGDQPTQLTLQLAQIRVDDTAISIHPISSGVQIELSKNGPTATEVTIPAESPFLIEERFPRNRSFSLDLDDHEVVPVVSPYQDLKSVILGELERRIQKCTKTQVCDTIRLAVAATTDPEIYLALKRASDAGLRVDWITFRRPRTALKMADRSRSGPASDGFEGQESPWNWIEGKPGSKGRYLQMHLKFIVFGDDLVISTNANFSFELYSFSRQISFVYRSKAVALLFQEIFGIVKTSTYYPLRVDPADNFVLLLNFERPRGHSMLGGRPYLAYDRPDGARTEAYGVVFDLLDASPGVLHLSMSPLTNYCLRGVERRCLFELLAERSRDRTLALTMNAGFYRDDGALTQPFWSLANLESKWKMAKTLVPAIADSSVRMLVQMDAAFSSHHERLAVLEPDIVLAGSANYAQPQTINTIEIIRTPAAYRRLRDEVASYDEPYYAVEGHVAERVPTKFESCGFIFERDIHRLQAVRLDQKQFSGRALVAALEARTGVTAELDQLQIVEPADLARRFEDRDAFASNRFLEVAVSDRYETYSSYQCVLNRTTGQTAVVFVPESARP